MTTHHEVIHNIYYATLICDLNERLILFGQTVVNTEDMKPIHNCHIPSVIFIKTSSIYYQNYGV